MTRRWKATVTRIQVPITTLSQQKSFSSGYVAWQLLSPVRQSNAQMPAPTGLQKNHVLSLSHQIEVINSFLWGFYILYWSLNPTHTSVNSPSTNFLQDLSSVCILFPARTCVDITTKYQSINPCIKFLLFKQTSDFLLFFLFDSCCDWVHLTAQRKKHSGYLIQLEK